jgi:cytochrome b561
VTRPLVILGALIVLAGDSTFQHGTMRHRLYAMGLVVGAVLAVSVAARLVSALRRPAPQRPSPSSSYYPAAPAARSRTPGSRGRSGRR